MRLILVMASLSSGMLGCRSGTVAGPLPIEVVVESDPGHLLSGVPVYVGADPLGVTGSDGAVRATRFDPPGTVLRLRCDCPKGYEESTAKVFRVRDYGERDSQRHLRIRLRCKPESRLAVFVVRARNGPHVDILLRGERVARTSSDGFAHFSRRVAPGSEQVVELHADSNSALVPERVSHFFEMPDADQIFVIDQHFDVRRRARRKTARRRIIKIE